MNAVPRETRKTQLKKILSMLVPLAGLLFVVILFGFLTKGRLFAVRNLKTFLSTAFPLLLGAISALFIYAQGNLNFIGGAIYALCSIFTAYLSQVNTFLAIVVCFVTGVGLSWLNSFIVVKAKIPSFVTQMAFSFAVGGLLGPLTRYTSISVPFSWVLWDKPWLKIVLLVVFGGAMLYLYNYSVVGKYSRAIGGGQTATEQSGISNDRILQIGFVISGFAIALCALIGLFRNGGASASSGSNFHFNFMIALVLGGVPLTGGAKAKFSLAVIGALTLAAITNGLTLCGMDTSLQMIVQAVIFIIVLVLTDKLGKKEGK